jgi:hypothetical protein
MQPSAVVHGPWIIPGGRQAYQPAPIVHRAGDDQHFLEMLVGDRAGAGRIKARVPTDQPRQQPSVRIASKDPF